MWTERAKGEREREGTNSLTWREPPLFSLPSVFISQFSSLSLSLSLSLSFYFSLFFHFYLFPFFSLSIYLSHFSLLSLLFLWYCFSWWWTKKSSCKRTSQCTRPACVLAWSFLHPPSPSRTKAFSLPCVLSLPSFLFFSSSPLFHFPLFLCISHSLPFCLHLENFIAREINWYQWIRWCNQSHRDGVLHGSDLFWLKWLKWLKWWWWYFDQSPYSMINRHECVFCCFAPFLQNRCSLPPPISFSPHAQIELHCILFRLFSILLVCFDVFSLSSIARTRYGCLDDISLWWVTIRSSRIVLHCTFFCWLECLNDLQTMLNVIIQSSTTRTDTLIWNAWCQITGWIQLTCSNMWSTLSRIIQIWDTESSKWSALHLYNFHITFYILREMIYIT